MKTKNLLAILAISSLVTVGAMAQITVSSVLRAGLNEPYNVVLGSDNDIYISDSVNNRIVKIDATSQAVTTLAGIPTDPPGSNDGPAYLAHFNNPQGLIQAALGGTNGLVVTDSGNNLVRFVSLSDGTVTTLAGRAGVAGPAVNAAGTNATFNYPLGLGEDANGNVYVADSDNNSIRVINLNDPSFGVTNIDIGGLYRPSAIAVMDTTNIWVADTGNNAVKLIALNGITGTVKTYMGSNDRRTTGFTDSVFGPHALFNGPRGLLWVAGAGLLIADTGNSTVRLATNYINFGLTNYSVYTFAGIPGANGDVDGPALSGEFNWPVGLALDAIDNGFLVADLDNSAIRRIQTGPPQPQVSAPQIGYVTFPPPNFTSKLITGPSFTFDNTQIIAILSEGGTETYYTYGPTPANPLVDTIPNPALGVGQTPAFYEDGLTSDQVAKPPGIVPPMPDMTIKAISVAAGRQNSPITEMRVQYVTANPSIQGDNAASFVVTDETVGAAIWYTTDGSQPTNASPSVEISSGATVSLDVISNLTFTAIAFNAGYQNSAPVSKVFSSTNFNPNKITFGFQSGEASSEFICSAGQTFYAPVTLSILQGTKMYSLQFNCTVSNLNSAPPVFPGAVGFESYLVEPWLNPPPSYVTIPPAMFLGAVTNIIISTSNELVTVMDTYEIITNIILGPGPYSGPITNSILIITNYVQNGMLMSNVTDSSQILSVANVSVQISDIFNDLTAQLDVPVTTTNYSIVPAFMDPPPANLIIYPVVPAFPSAYQTNGPFLGLEFVNSVLNLVGVGWLERRGAANLYDTTKEDLIKYSQPHDTIFDENDLQIVPGGFYFYVPPTAQPGDAYQIRVGRPSATSDGIGAPGSDVYIAAPTNGTLGAGSLNSIKVLTVGQAPYIAGSVTPFRWFNAGDFGGTNIVNGDVMQAFQSAVYHFNTPPLGSDMYDAMDSCCGAYVNNGKGYLEPGAVAPNDSGLNDLFYGDDTMINNFAFGNGVLDVTDVYVTFRRSLDPTLQWFQRFWTNGVLGAKFAQNQFRGQAIARKPAAVPKGAVTNAASPFANFIAGDAQASAGQTVQIPITANIQGAFPIRVLMLSVSVQPLDGSPALETPIQFIPNPWLGQPAIADSRANGNYAGAWLDSAIAGLTGNALLGTLTVTIPSNATTMASYAVHFDHISASPNGLASFPNATMTGVITLSDRSGSYYHDGIPDSWRLRYFGTIYNVLSTAGADADGTGMNNWQKYIAGLDPLNPNSVLRVSTDQAAATESDDCVVHWPTVAGKQYVIERSSSVYGPMWLPVSTNTGTGADMELHDTAGGATRFYRVRVLP